MGAALEISEFRTRVQPLQNGLELVCSPIQIKGVGGADNQMNASSQVVTTFCPGCFDDMRQVVVIPPVLDYARIDRSCRTVKHGLRAAALVLWREDRIEGRAL